MKMFSHRKNNIYNHTLKKKIQSKENHRKIACLSILNIREINV